MISFAAVTKETYDGLSTKVTDRLYFLTDTGELYLNNVKYGTDNPVTINWDESDSDSPAYIANKPDLSVYVEKVEGKGLSTNDFTDSDSEKLAGIAAGAEVNVQADWDESDSTADDYIKGKGTVTTAISTAVSDALTFHSN